MALLRVMAARPWCCALRRSCLASAYLWRAQRALARRPCLAACAPGRAGCVRAALAQARRERSAHSGSKSGQRSHINRAIAHRQTCHTPTARTLAYGNSDWSRRLASTCSLWLMLKLATRPASCSAVVAAVITSEMGHSARHALGRLCGDGWGSPGGRVRSSMLSTMQIGCWLQRRS